MSAPKVDVLKEAKLAAAALANLNTYAAVTALLEASLIYGGRHVASRKIIAICEREKLREYDLYTAAIARIGGDV